MLRRPFAGVLLAVLTVVITTPCVAATAPHETRVYANDFTAGDVGPEWSRRETEVTPKGNRRFLGGFAGGEVTFNLTRLPAHRFVRVSFDLFMIHPVDGSSPIWGPDVWDLTVGGAGGGAGAGGGPTLLHTTFTNCGFFSDNNEQAFPDEFPCRPHPGFTGALERQTLGYVHSWGGPNRTYDTSAVYRLDFTFSHDADALALVFTSFSREKKEGEAWGVTNFRVDVMTESARADAAALERLWDALASDDPVGAFRAKWNLAAAADDAGPFLMRKLGCDHAEEDKVAGLVAQFADDRSAERDAATKRLVAMGDRITPALLKLLAAAAAAGDAPEPRARITQALDVLADQTRAGSDAVRRSRAFHTLEVIHGRANPSRRNALTLPASPPAAK